MLFSITGIEGHYIAAYRSDVLLIELVCVVKRSVVLDLAQDGVLGTTIRGVVHHLLGSGDNGGLYGLLNPVAVRIEFTGMIVFHH